MIKSGDDELQVDKLEWEVDDDVQVDLADGGQGRDIHLQVDITNQ